MAATHAAIMDTVYALLQEKSVRDLTASDSQPKPLAPPALESDELTILTGWAQALAEALTYEPECVEALLADARTRQHFVASQVRDTRAVTPTESGDLLSQPSCPRGRVVRQPDTRRVAHFVP